MSLVTLPVEAGKQHKAPTISLAQNTRTLVLGLTALPDQSAVVTNFRTQVTNLQAPFLVLCVGWLGQLGRLG